MLDSHAVVAAAGHPALNSIAKPSGVPISVKVTVLGPAVLKLLAVELHRFVPPSINGTGDKPQHQRYCHAVVPL